MAIQIKSYPFNTIDTTIATPTTIVSGEMVQYLWLDIAEFTNEEYIEITYNGVTKTVIITDECKYTPVDVCFLNKEGAIQTFTFFKARKDSDIISSEKYQSNDVIGNHQDITYNVQARRKISLNTGFVTEDKNETIRQLLLSTKVWFIENGVKIPVKNGTSNFQVKTRISDKLINYEIDFEYAFNQINNV